MEKFLATFGELMLRLTPPGRDLLWNTEQLQVSFGGAEANVAAACARFGDRAEFITAFPDNELGDAAMRALRAAGVGTDRIIRRAGRMGIYFTESGSNMRPSKVVYDRENSAVSSVSPEEFDWEKALSGAEWFHLTGITPAVSESLYRAAKSALEVCRRKKIRVSFDINYRKQLWRWGKSAEEILPEFISEADVAFAGTDDYERCLGEKEDAARSRAPYPERFSSMCGEMFRRYPHLKYVATGLRESKNADQNLWGGILRCREQEGYFISRMFDVTDIVDRLGVGDSYAGGLIYALRHNFPLQECVDFAAAASALKHTNRGDFMGVGLRDVMEAVRGENGCRVRR